MATLTLEGLTRRHGGSERAALDGMDLAVRDGELLVLVGPSGCGKSTALRLVAGLDAPDGGRVLIDGRDVTGAAPQDRDVAMVFQGYALYPHLSARENIAFPLKMKGVGKGERAARVEEVAGMLGLSKLLERRPGELSGGERQRVAMGRAIVRRPKVFLFDEPLANLDAALRNELRVELSGLVRRLGTTAIYVTHDQAEAMTMGDRICVMRDGRVQQLAEPRAVYEAPANLFVATFLGAPLMNVAGLVRRGDAFEGAGMVVPASAVSGEVPEKVTVGVRPEHVVLAGDGARAGGEARAGGGEGAGGELLRVVVGAPRDLVELRGKVTGREPLGAETHVRLEAGGAVYWCRSPGFDAPALGAEVTARVDARRLLWFHPESGERLDVTARGEGAA